MPDNNLPTTSDKPDEQYLVGHQWGADMSYIGPYSFPATIGQDSVHLPPNTTLKSPPNGLPLGKEAAFDIVAGDWIVRDEDLSWMDADSRAKFLAAQAVEVQP